MDIQAGLVGVLMASSLLVGSGPSTASTSATSTTSASPAAATGTAAAERHVPARAVSFGTWNFCNHTCPGYEVRLRALARTLAETRPQVLALQEADVRGERLARVTRTLAPLGYVNANPAVFRTCPEKCESHIFVRSADIEVMSGRAAAGLLPMTAVSSRARGNVSTFAVLRQRDTGGTFLAVSLHLDQQRGTGRGGGDDAARNAAAAGLASWTARKAAALGDPSLPTLLLGDYNSYRRKYPRGPQWVLQRRGFDNAEQARVRIGGRFGTINRTPATIQWNGFPPRPVRYPRGGPRIDIIFTRNTGVSLRHEVVVRRDATGRFDERYRASDHNLVLADIVIP